LSESRARSLFLDYGTGGLKQRKPRRAPKPDAESESDDDSDAAKDLEVKAMVKNTVQLCAQVKRLEQQVRDLQLEYDKHKKEILDLMEEAENLKREKERTEHWHQRYQRENQDLRVDKARMALKQEELVNELYRVQVDHSRYRRETEKEKWMSRREIRVVEEKLSVEAKKKEAELTTLRMENEGLQKTVGEISALKEELNGQSSKSFIIYTH